MGLKKKVGKGCKLHAANIQRGLCLHMAALAFVK